MPHIEEYEILIRRSREFLIEADQALREGRYDLACFFAEQAVQLFLKAILLRLVGYYPRTHHVRALLSKLAEILPEDRRAILLEFMRSNRSLLSELEDVYVMARYSTRTYTYEDASDILKLAVSIIELVKKLVGE